MISQSRLPRSSQYAETYGDNIELLSRKNSLQACVKEIEEDASKNLESSISCAQSGTQNEDGFPLSIIPLQSPTWLRAFMSRSPLLQASAALSGSSYAAIPVRHNNTSVSPKVGRGKLRNRHRSSVQSTISNGIGVHSSEGSNFFEDITPLSDAGDDDLEDAVYFESESSRSGDEDPLDNSPSVLMPPLYTQASINYIFFLEPRVPYNFMDQNFTEISQIILTKICM